MILHCETPGHVEIVDQWQPEQPYWDCTAPDGRTQVACLDHAVALELAGWTSKRIQTEGQREREEAWAGVGVN